MQKIVEINKSFLKDLRTDLLHIFFVVNNNPTLLDISKFNINSMILNLNDANFLGFDLNNSIDVNDYSVYLTEKDFLGIEQCLNGLEYGSYNTDDLLYEKSLLKEAIDIINDYYTFFNKDKGINNIDKTDRGFLITEFDDLYGDKCSIQKSSLATDDAIWFGLSDITPRILASKAPEHGIISDETTGWINYPLHKDVMLNSRMHLSRNQVTDLLPILKKFVDTGDL